jgi:flavin reductase (DIM6/NTAB) family NADH-FMN oxidoreductase RutF
MAAPDPEPGPIAGDRLRGAMSRFPTGVTVVSTLTGGGPAGLAANAVTSLSLEPPLMLACLDRGARTLRAVEEAGRFAINVLGAEAEKLVRGFATKQPMAEKWSEVGWSEQDGLPWLDAAIVFVACDLRDVISGGDHVIVTGEVSAIAERAGQALAFVDGRLTTLPA